MRFKKFLLLIIPFMLLFCSMLSANAFSNCQVKYDEDKRSLPSLRGMCNVCHLSESGSSPRNEFGSAFANAGFMITDDLVAKFPNLFQKPQGDNSIPPSTGGVSEQQSSPMIKRVKPNKFKIDVQSMISIIGQNFVNGAKAFIDTNEVLTTFKSKALLIANFVLNSAGVHELKVKNPDGQESNIVKVKSRR